MYNPYTNGPSIYIHIYKDMNVINENPGLAITADSCFA